MSQMSCPSTGTADKPAAASTSATAAPNACSLGWSAAGAAATFNKNANAFVGFGLGVPASPLEPMTSMDPKDYVWGTPSQQQQQNLFQQFMQMAFFWHMAQNASLQSGTQPAAQPQMPMFPFGFSPMGPMGPMPFSPGMMPPFPGFPQAAPAAVQQCAAPPATSAPLPSVQGPNYPQMAPSTSAPVASCPATTAAMPQQLQPAAQQLQSCMQQQQPTDSSNTTTMNNNLAASPASVHLGEPHECDAIDLLLADVDLFPSSKAMHNNNQMCDQAGSPCSLSGSDGSTATVDSLFTSDLDSPISGGVNQAHAGLYLGADASTDLCLSDADFDAVMDGITGPSTFEGLGMDDYDLISLDGPIQQQPQQPQQMNMAMAMAMPSGAALPSAATAAAPAPVAAKAKAPARPRKAGGGSKATKVQEGGVAKPEKRSHKKGAGAAALAAAAAAAAATAAAAAAGGNLVHGAGSLLGALVQ